MHSTITSTDIGRVHRGGRGKPRPVHAFIDCRCGVNKLIIETMETQG